MNMERRKERKREEVGERTKGHRRRKGKREIRKKGNDRKEKE